MRRALVLLLAAVVTVVVVAVGVLVVLDSDDDQPGASAPSPTPTPSTPTTAPAVPLSEVDTLTTAVRREAFCDAVAPEAVEAALGGPPADTTSYVDGQSAPLTGEVRDIAHEFGCGWTTREATARAWVFAPPVTPATAKALVRAARTERGCRPLAEASDFGRPSVALACRTPRGVQASFRGLFGDAWLTCTVTGDDADVVAGRADSWCAAVLGALAT